MTNLIQKSNQLILAITLFHITLAVNALVEFDQDVTNEVIFGSGNANGAFTTDRRNGVEVGLRAKIPFVGTTNSNGDGTYSFSLAETDHDNDTNTASRWNFEYSINTDFDGSSTNNLDQYSYEIGIDADPGEGTDFLVFDPITSTMAQPFYDHSIGDNLTANGAGVEAVDETIYLNLLANNNLLQQSWRNAFFPFPPLDSYNPEAAGTYDVYFIVKLAGIEVARTDIKVYINQHDVTPTIIFGSGNANGDFTINRSSTVELGLRAKIPFVGLTNYDGDHTYSFSLAETDHDNNAATDNVWNFDFSVNTDFYDAANAGNNINDLTYEIGLDADPGIATNFLIADPITPIGGDFTQSPDHSFGDNSTANGSGVSPTFSINLFYEPIYNGDNNVVQNSLRYAFFPVPPLDTYDPNVAGTYDIYLIAKLAGVEVARVDIQVLIEGGAPNSAPLTIDDSYAVDEDMTLTVVDPDGVLDNDSDIDDDILNVVEVGVINADGGMGGSLTMAADGTFTYTPPLDFNGVASFSFNVTDGLLSSPSSLNITVNAVNDPPATQADTNNMNEDTMLDVTTIANGVLGNDSDVDGGALTVIEFGPITAGNPAAGTLIMFANGKYQYTPPADFNGAAVFDFTVSDGIDSTASSLTITVDPINDVPSFTKGADDAVFEDAGVQTINGWATTISSGATNEAGQVLTFTTSNDNNALFAVQPMVSAITGNLSYTPAADANGNATVTIGISDDGGVINGGDDTSDNQTFVITITAVNDEPSFTLQGNIIATGIVSAGNTTISINGFADNIVLGPSDESSQAVDNFSFNIMDSNDIINTIDMDTNGDLILDIDVNNFGLAIIEVTLQDDGGLANGGDDTSASVEFMVLFLPQELFSDGFETIVVNKSADLNSIPESQYNGKVISYYTEFDDFIVEFNNHKLMIDSEYIINNYQKTLRLWMQEILLFENLK